MPLGHPPVYSHQSHQEAYGTSSPTYSENPDDSERTLQHSPTSSTSPDTDIISSSTRSSTEFIYRSKHIELNLGPKLWGTKSPSYGRGGVVEGQLMLVGDLTRVASVQVKLEGRVMTTTTERGVVSGACSTTVLENTVTLSPPASGSSEWQREHSISFPFPSYVRGGMSPLPPTFTAYHPGATCEIKYWLKVTLVRKGFRRNDQMKITLLYLPKTFARGPSLRAIPNFIADTAAPTPIIEDVDHVSVIQLKPSWRRDQPCRPAATPPSVFFALPSELSFASHEPIPLTLSIVSHNVPALTKLLAPTIRIQLVKRTTFWLNGGRQLTRNDFALCSADVIGISEPKEGVCVMTCELALNGVASQQSWHVENVGMQQHVIRVLVHPPSNIADHVPRFEHEIGIDLATDAWDSPEREIATIGGTPRPALRFDLHPRDRAGSSSTAVVCARNVYMGLR